MSLIRVDRVDSGVLYCTVTHVPAHVSAAHPQQPQVTAAEEHVAQAPGHAATLTCRVTAVPVPVITWHRVTAAGNISDRMNTADAAGDEMNTAATDGDGMNTAAGNEMNTAAAAGNEMNTAASAGDEMNTAAAAGDEMNTVAAAGDEMTAVHSHGDTDIVISDYTDGVVTSSLVLGSVKSGDYGHYVCMATNGHGKVRFSN